jgi:FtsP/CotA-like multicopper oxidase with cupredoxin domain
MKKERIIILGFLLTFIAFGGHPAWAHVSFQCPCLDDGSAQNVVKANGNIECNIGARNIGCKHITGGDGFALMADRTPTEPSEIFIFSFHDVTHLYPPGGVYGTKAEADAAVQSDGLLAAEISAPTINVKEGQEFYLTLSTVPMPIRPDLFDPHTVHFHGFSNATAIFDGEPMASIAINAGASVTYYYNLTGRPGTHLYHCHVEATEHMQMGMLGNLFVRAAKDTGVAPNRFAYNDTDNSTQFHVEFPIQVISMDPRFHGANQDIQPLPFADMLDTYPLINGRGYPDTINPNHLPVPQQKIDERAIRGFTTDPITHSSQKLPSLITANAGQKILIRLSSVATVDLYTISASGLPMQIIGKDAKILRGRADPAGTALYQTVTSVNIGGGESYDIIINTAGVAAGTYFLYSTNLNELTNELQDFGGMMTEIVIQ